MKKRLIYFACYYSDSKHAWYSSGGNTKVLKTLNLLKKISRNFIFANFTPNETRKIVSNSINICKSHNIIFYSLEILFSFLLLKKELKNQKELILFVYNPRFTSLLFFFSSILFGFKSDLIIQVEDIPGARKTSSTFIDKLSFKFLLIFAKHLFFASKGMLNAFQENNPKYKNISIYPPSLSNIFINKISRRKKPFTGNVINVTYAGGYSEEKGIYDLINIFQKTNLKNYKLNVYGYFPEKIQKKYLSNNNIIFHGYVTNEELFDAYSISDILVNPHKLILNNNFIFPYKNIEIFASGAFPIVSKYSVKGVDNFGIDDLCIYKDLDNLKYLLENAPKIWAENSKKYIDSSKKFLINYSDENSLKIFKKVFKV